MARTSDKSAPDRVDVHVGKRIRARRRLCKISQVELANSIGLSFQQIQKYERGLNRVSASKLYAIAKHLGAPISHFFEGLEDEAEGDRGPRREQNVADFLATDDGQELVDAFRRMENQRLRRGCIDFVKLLAAETRSERLG
jgi:transcriptional regulator with XRE-family HTH domain